MSNESSPAERTSGGGDRGRGGRFRLGFPLGFLLESPRVLWEALRERRAEGIAACAALALRAAAISRFLWREAKVDRSGGRMGEAATLLYLRTLAGDAKADVCSGRSTFFFLRLDETIRTRCAGMLGDDGTYGLFWRATARFLFRIVSVQPQLARPQQSFSCSPSLLCVLPLPLCILVLLLPFLPFPLALPLEFRVTRLTINT